jgi:hypothetical protein
MAFSSLILGITVFMHFSCPIHAICPAYLILPDFSTIISDDPCVEGEFEYL